MTGLELLKAPGTTAEEIVDIIAEHCPPVVPAECDHLSCRECWLAWLVTGEPPREAETRTHEDNLDLTRLRKLLQEMDAYVAQKEGEPPDERTAQEIGEELIRLKQLLKEIDDYVSGSSHDHTSQ